MKNLKRLIAGLAALTFIALFGVVLTRMPQTVRANPSRFEHNRTAAATSTVSTVTVAASTTLTFLTNGADRADMLIIAKASSSDMSLIWSYEYSDNNVDWFGEDYLFDPFDAAVANVTGSTQISHSSTTPIHVWKGASGWTVSASTSNKTILNIPLAGTDYMRVKFGTSVATGTIWGDVITKIQETY